LHVAVDDDGELGSLFSFHGSQPDR
jgi:hypothetical protein